jgi:hypothetical protein
MVGHVRVEAKPAEPAVGQIEVNLVAQPSLGMMPWQQPASIRIINSGSIEGRPTSL